ncbi:MAG: rhomboid family intramembrane serine protease [Acidobacteria bacterium]|nr:rhomboid family intramembrane serine protease [Acidobacteriota bacterium]
MDERSTPPAAREKTRLRLSPHGFAAVAPATSLLIGLNIAIFVAITATGMRQQPLSWQAFRTALQHPTAPVLLRWGANFGPETVSGWWGWARLITSIFVHIGLVHLIVNMWALLNLGFLGEYLFGSRTTLLIYLVTGAVGSLASLAWNPRAISAGASGAIFGLAGALLMVFPFARLPLSRSAVWLTSASLVIFAVYNLAYGFITSKVDNAAHLGGLGAGLVFGLAVLWSNRGGEREGHELGIRSSAALALTAAVAAGGAIVERQERYAAPLERGEVALRSNNLPLAMQNLTRAVSLRPKAVEPHVLLGEAYLRAGDARRSEAQLKDAVRLGPRNAAAWRGLGFVYFNTRRAPEAAYAFGQAVKLEPKMADGQLDYGLALQFSQRLPEAIAAYQTALKLDGNLDAARYMLGTAFIQAGKPDDAISNLKDFVSRHQGDPDGWLALAEAYRRKGMAAEAQAAQQTAEKLRRGRK